MLGHAMLMAAGGNSSGSPAITDPLFSYVKSLLHFESDFTDVIAGNSWAATGTAIDTTAPLVGSGSAKNTSSGAQTLILPNSPSLVLGAGDFCIELTARFSSLTSAMTLFDKGYSSSGGLFLQGNNAKFTAYVNGAAVGTESTGASINTTYRYCIERASGVFRIMRDGNVTLQVANTANLNSSANICIFNAVSYTNTGCIGSFDEFRLTIGASRYGGAYTPSTEKFPDA